MSKMTTKPVCDICAEFYNKVNRKVVTCGVCDFNACRECVKKYILGSKEEPVCMSCKVLWDRNFLTEQLGKTFMTKDYRDYREELLIEREMGMLQATQPHVEREIRIERLQDEIFMLRENYLSTLAILDKELKELKNGDRDAVERKKFIRKCPNGDCHGFLSSALKCELCECWVCSECREIKGFSKEEKEMHECNKDILESVKLLEKDSKQCPKCTALIFKIEGCDQMYCVECHTAFSWKTLKIESGVIHNPHYFEYQRLTNRGVAPRNPNDIQCGRELDQLFVSRLIDKIVPLPENWRREVINGEVIYYNHRNQRSYVKPEIKDELLLDIIEICRQVIHVRFVEQPRFATEVRLYLNMRLRIDFMRNKINRDEMKKILQKREKENTKKTELSNIIAMYVSCMTDLFYRLYDENNLVSIKKEMIELRKYVNECFKTISKSYNCKQYSIDKKFHFV
jgi:hypothetical protein